VIAAYKVYGIGFVLRVGASLAPLWRVLIYVLKLVRCDMCVRPTALFILQAAVFPYPRGKFPALPPLLSSKCRLQTYPQLILAPQLATPHGKVL